MSLSENVRQRRRQLVAEADDLAAEIKRLIPDARSGRLSKEDARATQIERRARTLHSEVQAADERIVELEAQEAAEARAAATRVEAGEVGPQSFERSGWSVGREQSTYTRAPGAPGFVADMVAARSGDYAAAQRLHRNNQERASEKRALGSTGGTGGSGAEFSPPAWFENEYVALARAARVTADRTTRQPLPSGVSSINLPKVLTGTVAAVQTTQNTTVANVDMTTGALTSGITTIAGRQVISLQLLQQSPVAFDQVVLADLAADTARALDKQVISGTGTSGQLLGILNVPGITQITYNQATPTVGGAGGLYATINKAISAVASSRFLPPDCIIMTPARWSFIAAASDASGRPLVSPSGNAFNQIADAGSVAAQGAVGQMAGLPVLTDASLPQNLGTTTNQDPVIVGRLSDVHLWESDMALATFDAPYADAMGVLVRCHQFSALIAGRYPSSLAVITGTGLVPPAY